MYKKTKITGILTKELKNGDISYYGNVRHPITNIPTKIKIGSKLKDKIKNPKDALKRLDIRLEEIRESSTYKIPKNKKHYEFKTLNQLSKYYYRQQHKIKITNYISKYQIKDLDPNLDYLEKDKILIERIDEYKKHIREFKKREQKYNLHIKNLDYSKCLISDIHNNEFQKTQSILKEKGLSERYSIDLMLEVKTILNYAIENDLIKFNPLLNKKIKSTSKKNNNTIRVNRERYLSLEELNILLRECKKDKNQNIYNCVLLGVMTAARKQSILAIKKKHIDLYNSEILIHNFKSQRDYFVPIPFRYIIEIDKMIKDLDDDDFVIQSFRNKHIKNKFPLENIPKKLNKIINDLFNKDLDKKNRNTNLNYVVSYHTIRHSVATNLAKKGVSLFHIGKLLDHSDLKTTQIYSKYQSEHISNSIENFIEDVADSCSLRYDGTPF